MDTAIDDKLLKEAGLLTKGKLLFGVPLPLLKGYLSYAAALGLGLGTGAGFLSSAIKKKNVRLESLKRKKEFYDRKVDEMKNENWLNDLMETKQKLDTGRISDEERADLEKKYVDLIGK